MDPLPAAQLPNVASLAEAWIETKCKCSSIRSRAVASLAEAWIETKMRERQTSL